MMSSKKQKPIDLRNLEPEEKMKYEIAEELGLLDRVLAEGWKGLTGISIIRYPLFLLFLNIRLFQLITILLVCLLQQ